jgi:hypothetical protein
MTYSPDHTPRLRDRQNVAAQREPAVAQQAAHTPDAYEQAYYRRQDEQQAETTRRERQRAEKQRVAEAHRLDAIRMAETQREIEERNQNIVEHNLLASEIRSHLSGCTGDEIQAVLKLVGEWKMTRQPFAYGIALKEVRAEKK